MIIVLIVYMLFASTFTLGKIALGYCEPIFFVAIRMLTAGFLLLSYEYLTNRAHWKFDFSEWFAYLKLIVFHIFVSFNLEFWALKYVSGAKACLIYNLSPFITALYAYHLLKEHLHTQQILGLILGFTGFFPILLASAPLEDLAGSILNISLPEIALLGAVASSAFGWITFKKLVRHGHSFVFVNGIAMLGGGILSLFSSFLIEGMPKFKVPAVQDAMSAWLSNTFHIQSPIAFFMIYALLLIIIANIMCYNLYGYLLKRYSATFLSFAGFTCPLFAALFDWLFVGQLVTWHFMVTLIITMFGLYLFYKKEHSLAIEQ